MLSMIIVDDEFLVRRGISETINWAEHGIEIVAEAVNGQEGIDIIKKLRPDIVITDICMPVMDGLSLIANVKNSKLNTVVIVLSGYGEFNFAKEAMKNGAFAYILKPIDEEELIQTVEEAAAKVKEKEYHKNLETAVPMLHEHFINDLFHGGKITKQMFVDKTNLFHCDIDYGAYCMNYVMVHQQANTDIDKLHEIILRCFEGKIKVLTLKSDDGIAILGTYPSICNEFYDTTKEVCSSIISKSEGCILTVGISSMSDEVEDVSILYREAVQASSFRNNPDFSSVVNINQVDYDNLRKEVREAIKFINVNYKDNITVKIIANNSPWFSL